MFKQLELFLCWKRKALLSTEDAVIFEALVYQFTHLFPLACLLLFTDTHVDVCTHSCFILLVKKRREIRGHLHHPIVGNAFGGGFNDECMMVGERDYSSSLAVPAAVELFKSFGGGGAKVAEVICRRKHNLVVMKTLELAELWGT
mmetsp:Transcript_13599/g.21217  ORF Transcript_13599/g.21217 Transcript_13599/m.21217 type:complete len:145 (-) Transcript_13599:74-508(-)